MDGCYEMLAKHSQNETNEKKKCLALRGNIWKELYRTNRFKSDKPRNSTGKCTIYLSSYPNKGLSNVCLNENDTLIDCILLW